MKSYFSKITSLLLAFLVLFSTVSWAIDQHFCGDMLVDTALFSKAEGCGMELAPVSNEGVSISQETCCSDEATIVQGQDVLDIQTFKLKWEQQVFVEAFVYSYLDLFENLDKNVIPFKDYIPPLLVQDIQVLNDTFII
ncbi:HYC_CC_PP family protein [Imtechella halotolerans]|uniref:Secreted protein n=1 Tax=Imtechella halotolerans K1 TaxID=946077 RepID=I0WIB0_9FLAO|nr:hypothetical protein [Imtechella halotolerans]EID76126.1 hypothetical protein W5A_04249 [Imtechella halotolerans K1]WMQ63313.1 hypothetical protein PT603_13385 [Imtechella halotolerans]